MKIIMVTGGARSGKSSFAQELALRQEKLQRDKKVVFIATALVGDAEMRRRVELHRLSRPSRWLTVEEPWELGAALSAIPPDCGLVLVDCLTVWLSNMLLRSLEAQGFALETEGSLSWDPGRKPGGPEFCLHTKEKALEEQVFKEMERFLARAEQRLHTTIVVTNEVGWGVVPEHCLGRLFRDLAGKANQQLAARADLVYLLASGIPLKLKG